MCQIPDKYVSMRGRIQAVRPRPLGPVPTTTTTTTTTFTEYLADGSQARDPSLA